MSNTVVIIGAGHAAGQAVASLRQEKFEGNIVVVGEESVVPYQRPPLSKKFLAGEIGLDRVLFKPVEFYAKADADMILDTVVEKIDTAAHKVHLEEGRTLDYSKLIITTGGRVRKLTCPGADLPGVHYLRTIADVEAIRADFSPGAKLVIVGGGYIGLEVAAVAVKHGIDVTVLEMAPTVLGRVTCKEVAHFFERVHGEEGVKILTNTALESIEGDGKVSGIKTGNGDIIPADFVIAGIGILPNMELAADAGIECGNGIVVDDLCQTSDPDVYAAGDCTFHPNPIYQTSLRLESVHNALEQAKTAAAAICGKQKPYGQVPWFWSDQYDLKLQIAGLSQGFDQVVIRGDISGRSFAAFYLKDGKMIAVDAINRAPEFMMSRMLLQKGTTVSAERLADESIDMKEIAD
ncbi:FAD-dependent oxidoreductase [Pyruvatibacter sp.]|uniref:NAD(P)/FAD-dependent oxidoreductase n=1 Tax=Pyruvatibacter sp. TaxID=1981328 RepID=UPI0032ED9642